MRGEDCRTFSLLKRRPEMKNKRVLSFIVISIAFPIMMFSCGGGGIGDIDLSHWTTPLPGPIPNPGTAVPGPVPQLPPTSNAWIIETVDSNGAVGNYNSIAVDSSGKVHISYSNYADIKYATNSSGSWVTETVDSEGIEGASNSIAADSSGKVHISYSGEGNAVLKYAVKQ